MILFKENPINFVQQEAVLLEVEKGAGYVYLSKNTYDQVVLLNDRFDGETALLKKVLATDATHYGAVGYFYNNAPEPLSILAPFIAMVRPDVPVKNDLKMLCGLLHQMSMIIDFNEFVKAPAEIRTKVTFTRSTLMNYERSWEDIEVKIKTVDFDMSAIQLDLLKVIIAEIVGCLPQPVIQQYTPNIQPVIQQQQQQIVEETIQEEEDEDIDPWAMLGAMIAESVNAVGTVESKEEVVTQNNSIGIDPDEVKELDAIDKLCLQMSGGR